MKRFFKLLFSRFALVALTIILMFAFDVFLVLGAVYALEHTLMYFFPSAAVYIEWTVKIIRWIIVIVAVLHIVNRDMIPEAKIPWLLCVIVLNVFGVAVYFFFSYNRPTKKQRKMLATLYERSKKHGGRAEETRKAAAEMGRWSDVSEALFHLDLEAVACTGTKTEYFSSGEAFFERLLGDLERAEKYIFLEYFILARGKMWNDVLEVLKRKAREGVEVRVMYDDIGCMGKLRAGYYKSLCKEGISCIKFNPFVPVVTNVHNNRDHRKIAVIDGVIGYTGGINLADEYINAVQPYGHWKDTAVRLEGEGVRNLVLMFLHLNNARNSVPEDFSPYVPEHYEKFEGQGVVQPYGDGPRPVYKRHVGENVYINILNTAKKYVWIMTPYLIIDYRMREALISAATRGVDVRIVTPHIPDKKPAFALTRSNYMALIKGGVKIFEYTPGFVHAKSFIADGEIGVVGTINLDYRSLIHHYENAVLMYKTEAIASLEKDMLETFEVSALQTEEDAKKSVVWRGICEIIKVFAPLF